MTAVPDFGPFPSRLSAGGGLEAGDQRGVDRLVAGDDRVGLGHVRAAVRGRDQAAGLAHDDDAAGRIPVRQTAVPIAVETPGSDPGEVHRGGSGATEAGYFGAYVAHLGQYRFDAAIAADRRQAGSDDGIGELLARGDAEASVVEEGALPALGDVKLVQDRVVD